MGNPYETARPGNRGDQLAPLCNSRDQFLSRKEQPYQQLGRRVYPRGALIGKRTIALNTSCVVGTRGPPSRAQYSEKMRQDGRASAATHPRDRPCHSPNASTSCC